MFFVQLSFNMPQMETGPDCSNLYSKKQIHIPAYSFDKACERVNAAYHKNQTKNEIKSHHYILSFDPRDGPE